MKTHKLVQKMDRLLKAERPDQQAQVEELLILLEKLRKRRNALKEQLRDTHSEAARQKLDSDLEVLKMQRRKGQQLLAELTEPRDPTDA